MKIIQVGNFQICPDMPFLRFKGSKRAPAPPPPPAPVPTPREIDEQVKQREIERRRQKVSGRAKTILTQGQSLSSGGATILGRSNAT